MRRIQIVAEGVPILLYDEGGVAFLARSFGRVERYSLGFTLMGSRTTVVAVIQVVSPTAIPAVATVDLANTSFVVRL